MRTPIPRTWPNGLPATGAEGIIAGMTSLVHLTRPELETKFGKQPFTFGHELATHPMTSLETLAELADVLPPGVVEHNVGKVPEVAPGGDVPRLELTPGEMVRTIATNGCWVVLPLHEAPEFKDFYDSLFDDIQEALPAREGRIRERQAVFFLASSGSTTPTHIDLEQGFLLHIRGAKEIRLGSFVDGVTGQREVERKHTGGHRNLSNPPQSPTVFHLEPGMGVHVPAFTPHVVHTGPDQVALSLAVAVRTEATVRTSAVHRVNARLRRVGLKPRGPGERVLSDRAKSSAVSVIDGVTSRRRRRA